VVKIFAIAGVNLRRTLRERSNIFFLVVFPMLLILILGVSFGGEFTPRVGIVAAELDRQPLAAELVSDLEDSAGIDVRRVDDQDALTGMVERGQLEAGLVVPAGYDAELRRGAGPELTYLVRPGQEGQQVAAIVNSVIAEQRSTVQVARFLQEQAGQPFEAAVANARAAAQLVAAIQVETSTAGDAVFPASLGRFDLGASAELVLFIFITSMTAATALVETRRLGVSRRMLSTPTGISTVIAGEALGRLAVAATQGVIIMVGSALVFGVSWGDPVAAVVLMLSFALVASAVGLLVGAVSPSSELAIAVGLLFGLGLGALGGSMMPLEFFPPTMLTLAHVTPHAWANEAFAELVRHGGGLLDIMPQLAVLLGAAAAIYALAAVLLRRNLTR
jgi:ABC-2 type transport system permease protein